MSLQSPHLSIPNDPPRRRHSLFWKVLALVLATAVMATISIGVYFQYVLRDTYNGFLREQIGSYMQMTVDDIGFPPDTSIAARIAQRYPIDVRVERDGFAWTSDTSVTSASTIVQSTRSSYFDRGDTLLFRRLDSHLYGIVNRRGWSYIIRLRSAPEEGMLIPATITLGLVLMVLFVGAYRIVQRFLRPVPALMEGVKAVASEDFDHQVPVCSNDELGELTKAFNAMSQRVAAIIASKRRLLFDVSHELRSPLTRMNVALVMLPEGKAKLSIERNIRELNTMITELLENERLAVLGGSLVVETVDVVALVTKVIESFGSDTRRIELDSLTGQLEIQADGQRLAVAARNVISNALKYSTENNGTVKVTVFPDDNGARVVVADNGIGIPPEAQEKVFEAFYRTDDSRSRATGGYGLGLSLTKSIVEAHGGTIQLNSTLGCGTTIMMWLPHAPSAGAVVRNVTALKKTAQPQ
jgi:signal transduction histidine kinase